MEGAEHYREAELLLAGVDPHGKPRRLAPTAEEIARAQVHATLALAAAQIAPLIHQMCGDSNRVTDWGRVINWDTVPDAHAYRAKITDALLAGRVADLNDHTDWQRGYRACWERVRHVLDPSGEIQASALFPSETEPF